MNRVPVKSSQIASIGHDPATNKLHVEFKAFKPGATNTVYEYDDVPAAVHAQLMGDGTEGHSVGTAFGTLIKKGGYAYRKVMGAA